MNSHKDPHECNTPIVATLRFHEVLRGKVFVDLDAQAGPVRELNVSTLHDLAL